MLRKSPSKITQTIRSVVWIAGLLALGITPGDAEDLKIQKYRLSAGDTEGVYFRTATEIARIAASRGVHLEVLPSSGSIDNLQRLQEGSADLCLAQSDIVSIENSKFLSLKKPSPLRVVLPLYTEVVHILVRAPLFVRRIGDLKGKRVFAGAPNSGTEKNAVFVLEAAGVAANDVSLVRGTLAEMSDGFLKGTLDAAFLTSSYPSDIISDLITSGQARLFELDSDHLTRLLDSKLGFIIASIPAGTYRDQEETISTLGVPALLLASDRMDTEAVFQIAQALLSAPSSDSAASGARSMNLLNRTYNPGSQVAQFHPGTERLLLEQGYVRSRRLQAAALYFLVPGALIIAGFLVFRRRRRLFHYLAHRPVLRAAIFLVSVLIIGSVIMFYAEHRVNESYSGFFISFWSTLCNWINFGAKEPYTLLGRATSIAMTIVGVGAISWFTGQVASVFVHKKLRGLHMCEHLSEHYVIINWNEKAESIIQGMRDKEIADQRPILVLTEDGQGTSFPWQNYKECYHLTGNPLDEESLKKARIAFAQSIIILQDQKIHGESADARNVLITLTVARLCNSPGSAPTPVVVEMEDPKKAVLADISPAAKSLQIEVVSSRGITQNLIIQAALNPGLTQIYDELLTFKEGSSEVYRWPVKGRIEGMSWSDLRRYCLELSKGNGILPLAMEREGKILMNPSDHMVGPLRVTDSLFIICDNVSMLKPLR